jgi:hypothetical protein
MHNAFHQTILTFLVFPDKNANLVADAHKDVFPNLEFQNIVEKGKSKSFEITLKKNEEEESKIALVRQEEGSTSQAEVPGAC